MKKFLLKTCWFILPLLIAGVIMELGLRNIPSEYEEKSNFLKKYSPVTQTLILGSSHALYGINPETLLTPAFNLSHVSQTIDLDLALLKKFGPQMQNLERVVVTLSYFSLRETLETTAESWRIERYQHYYDLKFRYSWLSAIDLLRLPFSFNITRLKQYYLMHQQEVFITPKGWSTKYRSTNSVNYLTSSGRQAADRHSLPLADTRLIEKNKADLRSIADWCTKRQIKLYLVTTPTHTTYTERMNLPQWKEVEQEGLLIQELFPGVVYLNWLSDPEFENADFHDGDHLSEKGANKLTKRLQDIFELETPL